MKHRIPPDTLHNALKTHFGFDSFRPDQQAIIENVLSTDINSQGKK